jgi:hypothetical protein
MKHTEGYLPVQDVTFKGADPKIAEIVRKPIDQLIMEIQQTILSIQDIKKIKISRFYICGGTALLRYVDKYINESTGITTTILSKPKSEDFQITTIAEERTPIVMSATANALKAVGDSRCSGLNYCKGNYTVGKGVKDVGIKLKQVGIIVAVLILILIINFAVKRVILGQQVAGVNQDISTLAKKVLPDVNPDRLSDPKVAVSILKGKNRELEEKLKSIGASGETLTVMEIFTEISDHIPKDVKLDVQDLTINQKQVVFKAVTDSFESVDIIKNSLEGYPKFENVTTGNVVSGVRRDSKKFDLSLEIGGQ